MNYTIIGAGKSGTAAAFLAQKSGGNVFLTESNPASAYSSAIQALDSVGIENEFGGHTGRALQNCDMIIVSPGVPPFAAIIQSAESKKIPIISELEFASQFVKNPIIAITGTNGKTTTTALTTHILNSTGKPAIACGNIGTPLSALVSGLSPETILVVEASSYQLDRTIHFRPDVAAILNITPDHLGYHGSLERYVEAKWKISLNQNEKNVLILNADDALSSNNAAYLNNTQAEIIHFSMSPVQQGAYMWDNRLVLVKLKEEELMQTYDLRIPGMHNIYNSLAASLAARAFEVRNEDIRDSLMSFVGVEHRLEYTRTVNGVDYINDSKATNVNSTWYALCSFQKPLVWIAGGRGDGNNYLSLEDSVGANVEFIIAIGEEADSIFNHFCASKRVVKAESLEQAVEIAAHEARSGSAVLFSPACKSFDMFANFEHRGEVFKEAVNKL